MDFKSVGKNVIIWPGAEILNPEVITLGDHVMINAFVFIEGGLGGIIGDYVHLSTGVYIIGGGSFEIGDFCTISAGAHLVTGSDDFSGVALLGPTVPMKYRNVDRSFVCLKDFAAVATNAVILPGITIGEGAVVGAGAVVTKDCKPWTIYVGVPARPLKQRSMYLTVSAAKLRRKQGEAENNARS